MEKRQPIPIEIYRKYIRQNAEYYLGKDNITSIGVGYKVKSNGELSDELCIQFTVREKLEESALESLGIDILPEMVSLDGYNLLTDVLERDYDTSYTEVEPTTKIEKARQRKSAINPIVPGVSVSHRDLSAGTIGCVVYDSESSEKYILSNWHVLQGASGRIGDDIIQPGYHDDNRVSQNIVGTLIRSHLGVAGDCAVASVSSRELFPEIVELGTDVKKIADPDLNDRVVKSGRTTGVTYGTVARIDVITRINYPGIGNRNIGCFEVRPDPQYPANRNEISEGGDSGSAWLIHDKGTSTDVMVGLHFAGEIGKADDHALACYASSVFEKLEVLPQPLAKGNQSNNNRKGYDSFFLGVDVPMPIPASERVQADLVQIVGHDVIPYTHFSIGLSRSRKFARWVAWNIDGKSIKRISRKGLRFRMDSRIEKDFQVNNSLYRNNPLDRGHIARRADLCWGSLEEAKQANYDSFYYTNICPQHEAFNQSKAGGIWGELENSIFSDVEVNDLRVSVMGGPILQLSDQVYREVQIPKEFWKVIFFREGENPTIQMKGFILSQKDLVNNLETLDLAEYSVFEVPLSEIENQIELRITPQSQEDSSRGIELTTIRKISSSGEIWE